jgi:hypothetical protein
MLRPIASSLASILLAMAAGCVAQSGDPAPGSASDLAERLSEPLALGFVPSEDGSFARVNAITLRDGEVHEVEVTVMGGSLTLSLDDGELRVESMEVTAADVSIDAGVMPPDGATLTGISVALSAPVQAVLSSTDEAAGSATGGLPVDLAWAVQLDHGVVDLAPIRMPELPFELALELGADGEVEAHLTASQPGRFWNWAGIFELRDLELDLVASSGRGVSGPVD